MPSSRQRWMVRACWTVLLVTLAAFLALTAWRGRLPHIDEIFYKAAGFHWAARGEFAAPELVGRLPWNPPIEDVFACYPPVYPFVFGLYTTGVGFGWRPVAMFDALLHASLCLATALLVLRMFKLARRRGHDTQDAPEDAPPSRLPNWVPHALACVAGLAVLPLGTMGRPDELAMLFALAMLAVCDLPKLRWAVLAGALWGLCSGTSIAAAGVVAPIAGMIVLTQRNLRFPRRLVHGAAIGMVAAVVFVACWVPLLLIHPRAFEQFVHHSVANKHNYFTWLQAWQWAWSASTQVMLPMVGLSVTALLLAVACWKTNLLRQWAWLLGGSLLGVAMILIGAKGKGGYFWFLGPWMIAATLVVAAMWWNRISDRAADTWRAILPRLAAVCLMLAPTFGAALLAGAGRVTQWAAVAAMPQGQTFADADQILEQSIPNGAVVLADELWPSLADRCKVFDASLGLFDNPHRVLGKVEYVALTANNSGTPGVRRRLANDDFESYLAQHFEVIHNQAGAQQLNILGKSVPTSAHGFGPVVLRRRTPAWVRWFDSTWDDQQ
jgi:hypothetical protein